MYFKMSNKKQKTDVKVDGIRGSGNKDGGSIGATTTITHNINPTTKITVQNDIDRHQSFKRGGGGGGGGQTNSTTIVTVTKSY